MPGIDSTNNPAQTSSRLSDYDYDVNPDRSPRLLQALIALAEKCAQTALQAQQEEYQIKYDIKRLEEEQVRLQEKVESDLRALVRLGRDHREHFAKLLETSLSIQENKRHEDVNSKALEALVNRSVATKLISWMSNFWGGLLDKISPLLLSQEEQQAKENRKDKAYNSDQDLPIIKKALQGIRNAIRAAAEKHLQFQEKFKQSFVEVQTLEAQIQAQQLESERVKALLQEKQEKLVQHLQAMQEKDVKALLQEKQEKLVQHLQAMQDKDVKALLQEKQEKLVQLLQAMQDIDVNAILDQEERRLTSQNRAESRSFEKMSNEQIKARVDSLSTEIESLSNSLNEKRQGIIAKQLELKRRTLSDLSSFRELVSWVANKLLLGLPLLLNWQRRADKKELKKFQREQAQLEASLLMAQGHCESLSMSLHVKSAMRQAELWQKKQDIIQQQLATGATLEEYHSLSEQAASVGATGPSESANALSASATESLYKLSCIKKALDGQLQYIADQDAAFKRESEQALHELIKSAGVSEQELSDALQQEAAQAEQNKASPREIDPSAPPPPLSQTSAANKPPLLLSQRSTDSTGATANKETPGSPQERSDAIADGGKTRVHKSPRL